MKSLSVFFAHTTFPAHLCQCTAGLINQCQAKHKMRNGNARGRAIQYYTTEYRLLRTDSRCIVQYVHTSVHDLSLVLLILLLNLPVLPGLYGVYDEFWR